MLPRTAALPMRWCARSARTVPWAWRAPVTARQQQQQQQQQRTFLPSPADLQRDVQKALQDAQAALEEAEHRVKAEAEKVRAEAERSAKALTESLESSGEVGRQASEFGRQALEQAQKALGDAQGEADKATKVLKDTLEVSAEKGMQFINEALSAAGSERRFSDTAASAPGAGTVAGTSARPADGASLFWSPEQPESPAKLGREAFAAKSLAQPAQASSLVPDQDVERYVDSLLSSAVLSNDHLPQAVSRQLYIRIVRIAQLAILKTLSSMEGEVLGKQMRLLKEPSPLAAFRQSAAQLDPNVLGCLTKCVLKDAAGSAEPLPAFLQDLGLDPGMVEKLYGDIITLAVRLVFDISLTLQVRCLGHAVTLDITPDEMLHTAPGWEMNIAEGVFGVFGDAAKKAWADAFVEEVLQDSSICLESLPEAAQKQIFSRVTLVLLKLAETALNHFRLHAAGMAFRPCLLDSAPGPEQALSSKQAAASE